MSTAHTKIQPIGGKAIVWTPGTAQYGKDVDGFCKINHPVAGVVTLNPAAVVENADGTIKHQGQVMLGALAKGSFVGGTWTDQ